jgi:hypothetical protein
MHVLVIHDEHGNIRAVGTATSTASDRVGVVTRSGDHLVVLEHADLGDEALHPYLRELMEDFRIETRYGQQALARRMNVRE